MRFATPVHAFLLILTIPAAAFAQRESWTPPRPDNWKKPPLVHWQRSLDDALALSKASGRPMLICVNMDGEGASENYAGIRYRDDNFAKLADAYIPLIVSVDRHNARDYDDSGRRIPCPRFGKVTCGEHFALEPPVFEKYFNNQRVAPRHIGVSKDGKVIFDCFLNFDVSPVVKALTDNAVAAPASAAASTMESRLMSRDASDREAVEEMYHSGSPATRKQMLQFINKTKDCDAFDILRMGMRDADESLRSLARKALLARANANAVPLLLEAVRAARDPGERDALVTALEKLSRDSARARWAALVLRAVNAKSDLISIPAWLAEIKKGPLAPRAASDPDELELNLQKLVNQSKQQKTPDVFVKIADANIKFAENRMALRKDGGYLLADAATALAEAEKLGEKSAHYYLLKARTAFYQNNWATIDEDMRKAIPGLVASAREFETFQGLMIFARAMNTRIAATQNANKTWPPFWLTDAHSAWVAAEAHPLADASIFAEHVDLLFWLDAIDAGNAILEQGLLKFPDSPLLHERLRARILEDQGLDGLERTYAELLRKSPKDAATNWFSAYASMVAAEYHKKGGRDAAAEEAYNRSLLQFDRSVELNDNFRASTNHLAALVLAGRGRIEMETGELEAAVRDLCEALARKPDILEAEDGLGRTPMITIRALRWNLEEKQLPELREKLEAALEAIDPELASRPAKNK